MEEKKQGEIILYQPNETRKLEVRIEEDTVWLTQAQMAELFQTTKQNISLHTNNIFREGELEKISVVKKYLTTALDGKNYQTKYFNLDVIISVGYRVKSVRGTQFRQWANKVLKEYLLKGYSINQRLEHIEQKMDSRFAEHDMRLQRMDEQINFFVRTSLPPIEGIFFDGQIFDAHTFVCDLIRSAKQKIVLIDNYIDDTVLHRLDKREKGVRATIYTQQIPKALKTDIKSHNEQYPPIEVKVTKNVHDRFMIIDDTVYHIGASIKDLGKKIFAFSKMNEHPDTLLKRVV